VCSEYQVMCCWAIRLRVIALCRVIFQDLVRQSNKSSQSITSRYVYANGKRRWSTGLIIRVSNAASGIWKRILGKNAQVVRCWWNVLQASGNGDSTRLEGFAQVLNAVNHVEDCEKIRQFLNEELSAWQSIVSSIVVCYLPKWSEHCVIFMKNGVNSKELNGPSGCPKWWWM
jgi:hypothetical protein